MPAVFGVEESPRAGISDILRLLVRSPSDIESQHYKSDGRRNDQDSDITWNSSI